MTISTIIFMITGYLLCFLIGALIITPYYLSKKYTNNNGPFYITIQYDNSAVNIETTKEKILNQDKDMCLLYSIFWPLFILIYIVGYLLIIKFIIINIAKFIKILFMDIIKCFDFAFNKSSTYFSNKFEIKQKIIDDTKSDYRNISFK